MRYKFDEYGWYVGEGEGKRSTAIEPVNKKLTGNTRSNFTGRKWVEATYVAPPITLTEGEKKSKEGAVKEKLKTTTIADLSKAETEDLLEVLAIQAGLK